MVKDEAPVVYIQIGEDETNPQWVYAGLILERVYEKDLENINFIHHIIGKYLQQLR